MFGSMKLVGHAFGKTALDFSYPLSRNQFLYPD